MRVHFFAFALGVTLLSFHAAGQTPLGSEEPTPAEYGEAQHFLSPALLDDLSQRFWDLEDETREKLRVKVGANAVLGVVHGSHVRAHAVAGPAFSLQISYFGRSAKRYNVLALRTVSLQGQPTERFKLLLAQECTRTKRVLSELSRRLVQTRHDLGVLKDTERLANIRAGHQKLQKFRIAACDAPTPPARLPAADTKADEWSSPEFPDSCLG